jgi:glycosyltransferase involved in cell wall biosynthesis
MLLNETIICMAPDPWTGLWRNRHQIMTRLALHNTVLYVEPRLYLWETLRRFRQGRLRPDDLRKPLAQHYRDGLWVYHDPYHAPFSGRRSGGPVTARWRQKAMRDTLMSLNAGRPILWLLRPYQTDQIGTLNEKLVVYHVTDEYSAFPTVTDPASFREKEAALMRRADLVIVTSAALLESHQPFNKHTYLVPNAVDFQSYQQHLVDPPPARLGNGQDTINRPRIGYAGALNEKVDYHLLAQVAQMRPDWQLVLIGNLDLYSQPDKADALQGLPNVHWLGRLPLAQLPAAISSLDVCLMPYERNAWTANIDSLKLYEYMACGKPVVSTDIPAARQFSELVGIATSPEDFVTHIDAALATDTPAKVAARMQVASANTWENRVQRIGALLAEALNRRKEQAMGDV